MSLVTELKRACLNHTQYLKLVRKPFEVNTEFYNMLYAVVSENSDDIYDWWISEDPPNCLRITWVTNSFGSHKAEFKPDDIDRDLLVIEEILDS